MNCMDGIALVTGGTRGIGKAAADQLSRLGFGVVVTSRTAPFDERADVLSGKVIVQQLDVSQEESVARLFAWLAQRSSPLAILVNNAGIGAFANLDNIPAATWAQIIDVNLTGAFLCSQRAAHAMSKAGGGRIINIGSIVDKVPTPQNAAYGASKWGLRGLSRTIAEELKEQNVRVTHISLGAVWSDIWADRSGFSKADMLDVADVGGVIAYIASLPLSIRIDEFEMTPAKGIL